MKIELRTWNVPVGLPCSQNKNVILLHIIKSVGIAILCLALLSGVNTKRGHTNANAKGLDSFMLGGIQINEATNEDWTANLKRNDFNTVEVTVYARQNIWNTDDIIYSDKEEGVIEEIRVAKESGLKVALILRVTLDHKWEENRFLWHGMIMPKNDSLLNSWFNKYEQFVLKWAVIANSYQVEYFAIGSEMNSMTETIQTNSFPPLYRFFLTDILHKSYESRILKFESQLDENDLWVQGFDSYRNVEKYVEDKLRAEKNWATEVCYKNEPKSLSLFNKRRGYLESEWRNIIKNVKLVYKGKISFAANFDSYHTVSFWNEMDYISINAYFKLKNDDLVAKTKRKLNKQIKNHWQRHLNGIETFKKREGLRENMGVVFSELGYINKKDAILFPYQGFGFSIAGTGLNQRLIIWNKQADDLEERAAAIRCLAEVVSETDFPLKGVLYWKLTSHNYHLPYEPFAICIGDSENADPAIKSLQTLLKKE